MDCALDFGGRLFGITLTLRFCDLRDFKLPLLVQMLGDEGGHLVRLVCSIIVLLSWLDGSRDQGAPKMSSQAGKSVKRMRVHAENLGFVRPSALRSTSRVFIGNKWDARPAAQTTSNLLFATLYKLLSFASAFWTSLAPSKAVIARPFCTACKHTQAETIYTVHEHTSLVSSVSVTTQSKHWLGGYGFSLGMSYKIGRVAMPSLVLYRS